jgi:hypothetical protein
MNDPTLADQLSRVFATFDAKDVSSLADFVTGDVVTLPCCNVFRLRDGLIAEYRSYIDANPVYARSI